MSAKPQTHSPAMDSALTHVSGESEYIDDRPFFANELHVDVVYSEMARAKIKRVDVKAALTIPGVVAAYTAKDIHHLMWGTIFQDQPLLADKEVNFVGESIVILAAESMDALRLAKKLVKIDYEEMKPILSIRDARDRKSFIGFERKIERGNVDEAFKDAPHTLSGTVTIQGADHFYLESQAAVAYPDERGRIEVHSSTQHPTETQHVVAHALGLHYNEVVCITKRMGGGFGGKESQAAPYAAYAALVAHKLKRPARCVITKDDDMIATGKRNPFENEYKVAFDREGKILALDTYLYSDGGAYADLSTSIMERAMLHSDNAYYIPNARILGMVCRTNFHPHTAFRGFGGPKGVAMIEKIIEEIAAHLKKDPLEIRKLNVYREGADITPYGQKVENNTLPELFESLEGKCNYWSRRNEIEAWNKEDHSTFRGLSMTAVKFGISFTTRFLNQGNALVIVHRDGSIQVTTGATEMGQGVNTRIAQLVAEELGVPLSLIQVMPTRTDKNANTSPTAASAGTDLNGSAALIAAKKIRTRLTDVAAHILDLPESRWATKTAGLGTENEVTLSNDPLTQEKRRKSFHFENGEITHAERPGWKITFHQLVTETYLNRISLSEYGFYKVPHLTFNKITGTGRAFLYFTNGVAATEVSIDKVSGEVKVLRTDILMDLGRPINEGLDMGQVTGGFIQGLGWVTTENLYYSKGGKLLAHSPSTYKIPNVQDIPRVFNVNLIENLGNVDNVRGTKAVGEPPLLLALSAWTAISDAVKSARGGEYPNITIPATSERVLRALTPEAFQVWEK